MNDEEIVFVSKEEALELHHDSIARKLLHQSKN
jgi:dihydrodipicolinate reductase